MPSNPSSESSARPTPVMPPVIFRTSPACAPMRSRSAGASRAIAWPTSSTRASATRRVSVPVIDEWAVSVMTSYSTCRDETLRRSKLCIEYDLFHVFNVPPHRGLCRFRIASLDGSQNPTVPGERLLRASFHLQRVFTRVAQQVHQGVDHLQHDTVTGSQGDAVVEFRVLANGRVSATLRFLLPVQNIFHLGNFFGGSVGGGSRGQRRFDHLAEIQKLGYQTLPALQRTGKRVGR